MALFVQLRNGVPYQVNVAGVGAAYDQVLLITGDTTAVTLPLGQTYNTGSNELIVWVDGIAQETGGIDYIESSSTVITFQKTIKANQRVRIRR